VREQSCILQSCCLSPIRRNSVLEELRVRRLAVFDLSKKQWGLLGASRIFCVGAQMEAPKAPTGQRQRREDRGAEGAEAGKVWGGGVPLPSRIGGLGERRELPSGVQGGASAANTF